MKVAVFALIALASMASASIYAGYGTGYPYIHPIVAARYGAYPHVYGAYPHVYGDYPHHVYGAYPHVYGGIDKVVVPYVHAGSSRPSTNLPRNTNCSTNTTSSTSRNWNTNRL
ncbi:unnamed protein product [Acanthoscelides obtectus]|uniref:Uncharacterized protein n=1 Tax=Acanthoscelides obtectus TaxID=200917 RepID=A0A9P0LG18_ACAOB|nr:unnamed protein product [Acanthoscelides obtectus]CAK1670656.1 hypothetical protein AOBTE_LOCUS27737 [Acanthoscelides obtectus]